MQIDRKRALAAFRDYVSAYDPENPRIALKIAHTYRVAAAADKIARRLGLSPEDQDLAWLLGLLHDIGRFEQVRRYDTFSDAKSVSHAALGAEVLFGEKLDGRGGTIRSYVEDTSEDSLICEAISYHSAYALPDDLCPRSRQLSELLRDADKIDILKVNCTESPESIYGVATEDLKASPVSPEVVKTFYGHRTVPLAIRRYPADMLAGHICFVWGLAFTESLEIAVQQGYIFRMLAFPFTNEETARIFSAMDAHLRHLLEGQGLVPET